jgi:hypothetical protein
MFPFAKATLLAWPLLVVAGAVGILGFLPRLADHRGIDDEYKLSVF